MLGARITGQMAEMMRRSLALSREEATNTMYMLPALGTAAADGLWLLPHRCFWPWRLLRSSLHWRSAAGASRAKR